MDTVSKILSEIESKKIAIVLRKGEGDIDIFSENLLWIKKILNSYWAQLFSEDDSKLRYYFFEDSKRVIFDIEKNFDYIWKYFCWSLKLKSNYHLRDYKKYQKNFDTLRYLFEFRYKKEVYFTHNFDEILQNDFYLNCLEKKPFRKKINDIDILKKFLKQDLFTLLVHLKPQFFLRYIFCKITFPIRLIFKRLFSNNTYAILWYDGSGKTTICELLSKSFWVKCFYMWYKRYSQRWYYDLLDSNNVLKLVRLFFMLIDFWILYIQIFYYRIRYEFVFFDRHPKHEIYPHSSMAQRAISMLFFFYPSPKKNFILYNEPEIIRSRKKERSIKEINNLNTYIYDILSKDKRNVILKNDTIDDTLNTILKNLY